MNPLLMLPSSPAPTPTEDVVLRTQVGEAVMSARPAVLRAMLAILDVCAGLASEEEAPPPQLQPRS